MATEEVVQQANEPVFAGLVIKEGERFDELLELKGRDRKLPKRERTRCMVMARIAGLLLTDPGRRPSIESVINDTGLSRGTFYNYFDDIDVAVEAVLVAFFRALWSPPTARRTKEVRAEEVDAVYAANLWYCQAYETNAGLFAAFSHVSAYTPSLVRMREEMNAIWVDRVIESVSRAKSVKFNAALRRDFRGALRLLIAMSIEALRERHIHQDRLLTSSYRNAHELATGLTNVWNDVIAAYVFRANAGDK
jgi:AcrR family transcriptional regulator